MLLYLFEIQVSSVHIHCKIFSIFGHLNCMPVVYVTRNAYNLNKNVVEKLLPFVKLGSFVECP